MKVHYISPSTLPSRTANSIHVAWQCNGLTKAGADVTLYAKRSLEDEESLSGALASAYGIETSALSIVSFYSRHSRADNLRIAAMAVKHLGLRKHHGAIVSRNLYAALVLGVMQRRPLIFETHQLESGARKRIQRAVMTCPWIITVAISNRLVDHLSRHHGVAPRRPLVLPDAAPEGIEPIEESHRRQDLRQLVPAAAGEWDGVCGYFGHLYPGRGIEVLETLAANRPQTLFLVYGGNDVDVEGKRLTNTHPNLCFMGHVPHPDARCLMRVMDVLLLPYQPHVSIGVKGHDTADWMSPMKMFEYLASGVPMVASRLPALGEVLQDGRNCLMAKAGDPAEWAAAVDRILTNRTLASSLGRQAHADYKEKYTWTRRAEALLAAARDL